MSLALINRQRWRRTPDRPVRLNLSSPFCEDLGAAWYAGQNLNLASGGVATLVGSGLSWVAGPGGRAALLDGSSNATGLRLAADADDILPTDRATILMYRRSRDTTGRVSMLFGYDAGTTDRVLAHAPYSDGTCYFDFGNNTAGSGRTSVAFVKSTLPETLAFVAGPTKGREIWRNGLRLVNNTSATATRSTTSKGFSLGSADRNITTGVDTDEIYLVLVSRREWSDAEIIEWSRAPMSVLVPQGDPAIYSLGSTGVTLDCTVGNAVAAGAQANISAGTTINASVGNAAAAGSQANISAGTTINASAGNAVAAGAQASITSGITLDCTVGNAVAAGAQATISAGTTINASVGNAVAAGVQASITTGFTLECTVGNAVAAGVQAGISIGSGTVTIACAVGNADAAGVDVDIWSADPLLPRSRRIGGETLQAADDDVVARAPSRRIGGSVLRKPA